MRLKIPLKYAKESPGGQNVVSVFIYYPLLAMVTWRNLNECKNVGVQCCDSKEKYDK